MRNLNDYALALEKSKKPGDAEVGRFMRQNEQKLRGWMYDFSNGPETQEDLLQVLLLACVESARNGGDLKDVHNAMQRHARQAKAWKKRKSEFNEAVHDKGERT